LIDLLSFSELILSRELEFLASLAPQAIAKKANPNKIQCTKQRIRGFNMGIIN
jgi:hypothetical protein